MCTYPVQPICTFSCTSVFFINIINPQYTVLHILSHCTSYSFYFIICSLFHSHLYLYIYSLVLCSLFYCLCYFYFIFYFIIIIIIYFYFYFLQFSLSGPVLTYISLLIIPCMIVYVTNNKEPWTLTLNQNVLLCTLIVKLRTYASLYSQTLIDLLSKTILYNTIYW